MSCVTVSGPMPAQDCVVLPHEHLYCDWSALFRPTSAFHSLLKSATPLACRNERENPAVYESGDGGTHKFESARALMRPRRTVLFAAPRPFGPSLSLEGLHALKYEPNADLANLSLTDDGTSRLGFFLHAARCMLRAARCMLHAARCMLHAASRLCPSRCVPHAVRCAFCVLHDLCLHA